MKEIWCMMQVCFSGMGAGFGYFLGGCDGLIYALIVFVFIDYLSGVMCAVSNRSLSSEIGFKGICRKVFIFYL